MRGWAATLAPTLFVALLLGLWEGLCRLLAVPTYFLPTPSQITLALVQNAPLLFISAWRTLQTALTAFFVTALLAGASAMAAASGKIVEASFRPVALVLQVTPIVALAPLFQIWAGIDHPAGAVIALATVAAFFPIYSGVLAGLRLPPTPRWSGYSTYTGRAAGKKCFGCASLRLCRKRWKD